MEPITIEQRELMLNQSADLNDESSTDFDSLDEDDDYDEDGAPRLSKEESDEENLHEKKRRLTSNKKSR